MRNLTKRRSKTREYETLAFTWAISSWTRALIVVVLINFATYRVFYTSSVNDQVKSVVDQKV